MYNNFLCLLTFVLFSIVIIVSSLLDKKYLYAISGFIIIATNTTVGFTSVIFGISISVAVILYSLIYLITDIMSEFYEKNESYKLAVFNVIIQILFWVYIWISAHFIVNSGVSNFNSMVSLYSISARITLAAIIASLGSIIDIYIYEKIMHKSLKYTILKPLWIRNNISTIVGQCINTTIFFVIALYGVIDNYNLSQVILGAIVIRIIIALLDTPILYAIRYIKTTFNIL